MDLSGAQIFRFTRVGSLCKNRKDFKAVTEVTQQTSLQDDDLLNFTKGTRFTEEKRVLKNPLSASIGAKVRWLQNHAKYHAKHHAKYHGKRPRIGCPQYAPSTGIASGPSSAGLQGKSRYGLNTQTQMSSVTPNSGLKHAGKKRSIGQNV